MREIKFRGKRISDNTWIYGKNLTQHNFSNEIIISGFDVEKEVFSKSKIIPETLGQYAGLEDKDGTPIYEGDIVESVSWTEFFISGCEKESEPLKRIMTVVFHEGAFCLYEDLKDPIIPSNYWDIRTGSNFSISGDLKVMGNIFDNPELLN